MKRSHRSEEFESGYDQQLQQRPCIRGFHQTLNQDLTNVLLQELQEQSQQQQKPKALNSPISKITIGDWNQEATYPDDLIMKCYFARRKLVWEILEKSSQPDSDGNKLKRKIEINWSDLSSCQVHNDPQDNTGIFQIKISKRPTFAKETNQRPGKHTQWEKLDQDFTTNIKGSTSFYKTHTLYFAPGELQKNLEKLLSGDRCFWSTLLPIDSNNGSYLLPHPTHSLNVNCLNFNMERQQVPAANDDGREVVLNSVAENNSSEAYWKGVLQGNLMLQETTPQNMESLNLQASNTMINSTYPLLGAEARSLITQDPNLQNVEPWSCGGHASSLMLQDENMQNMDQLYWESVFDQMPPLEPIPEAVMPSLEPIPKDVLKTSNNTMMNSDPLGGTQVTQPNVNANSTMMYLPQNMEFLDLEEVLEDALKTSNPLEETLTANSMMMYLPQNNLEEAQISNTIINSNYPLRGAEARSMIAQDPNLEVFTWINTSNTTINNDQEANSMMMYPPQNMEHTQHVYDGRQVQNSAAENNWCELINNEGYWNEDYRLPPETQQGLSSTLQANLKLQDHENMQQNTEQLHWESVYDQMPPLEPIPEAEMPDLEVISEDVFKTSNTTTPQHHILQANLTETQRDLSQLPDLEVIPEAVLNTSDTTTSPLDDVFDFPFDFDFQDPVFTRAF